MRVIILGSGVPNPRKSQASASVLVELGNGDKFIFDVGSESAANLGALEQAAPNQLSACCVDLRPSSPARGISTRRPTMPATMMKVSTSGSEAKF